MVQCKTKETLNTQMGTKQNFRDISERVHSL